MTSNNLSKPKRTTIALTREEYLEIDKARKHFMESHGVSVSRTSFITSLAARYNRANGLEKP